MTLEQGNLIRQISIPLVLAVAICCSADTEERAKKLSEFERALSAVSPELLFFRLAIERGQRRYCIFDEEPKDATADPESEFFRDFVNAHRALCDLYNKLGDLAEPVFRDAVAKERAPKPLYSLSFFLEDLDASGDSLFREVTAGPFPDAQSCETMERKLREARLGTRKCTKWVLYENVSEER